MGSLEMTRLDLECGVGRGSSTVNNDESIRVSKTTEGSCSSQSYSAADSSNQGQNPSEIDQVSHSTRVSSVVATDCVVDIHQDGVEEVRISVERMERECRICMLSLDSGSGSATELGCSCKNDLAAVHQHCAETWFRSKGNKICEICKSVARNVVIPNNTKSRQQNVEENRFLTNAVSMPALERNTYLTNVILVPVSGRNASSTNVVSFQEIEVAAFPRNADLAPVSSTSECCEECGRVLVICGLLLVCSFVTAVLFFLALLISYVSTGSRGNFFG